MDARVNFGAAKLTVFGTASIAELEEAGAFENITLYPEKEKQQTLAKIPFWKRYALLGLSLLFLLAGYLSSENSLFVAAILSGGFPLFKTGLKNLTRLEFDMKTLMTIAIIGASSVSEPSS